MAIRQVIFRTTQPILSRAHTMMKSAQ